jgi:hypothetical protein
VQCERDPWFVLACGGSDRMGCIDSKPANIPSDRSTEQVIEIQDQERKIELAFKAKRQNVFTAGVDVSLQPPPEKIIHKSEDQRNLISKFSISSFFDLFQTMHSIKTLSLRL